MKVIKKISWIVFAFFLTAGTSLQAQDQNPLKYVNTLQGTKSSWGYSNGNTYPTVGLPFGMHFWSAQTGKNGDGWKYQYQADTIRGFQQVHQCSPWMGDYAVFSLMPVTGSLTVNENDRAAGFSHAKETAKPHYYSVELANGVKTEISPVVRGSHMRFSFPESKNAYLVLDGYTGQSRVKILPEQQKIIGYVHNGTFVPEDLKSRFVISFDQPFVAHGTWENENNSINKNAIEDEGKGVGVYLEFKPGTTVQAKIASSYISYEQAGLTLQRELGAYDNLEDTKEAAAQTWNALLGRIQVEGGTLKDKKTFYSSLFRANLFSRKFYEIDADGNPYYYSPYDSRVHEGYMYTDNGFWDTFRAQFPLSNILHPEMQGRYMQTLLDAQDQSGWLPTWSNPGQSGVMIGNHAISLLTDAWAKGIRSFNPDSALAAYYHEATNKGPWGGSNGREGHKYYFEIGYIPYPEYHESTAKTLEYAYDDFAAYKLAKMTGNDFYQRVFARQMYNYKNVFDPSVGFMRGRNKKGEWRDDFSAIEWGGPFTEANAWHYSWSVFHNVADLIQLMGGEERFSSKLDSLFTMSSDFEVGTYGQEIHEMTEMVEADMGQYAHGNQPVQHVPYLYNYIGQPWKTQARVREIMDQLYNPTETGFPGDEDQGQMSSWFVLSALGIYDVTPGTDQYNIGSPLFNKATIMLSNGNEFVIKADNNSAENVYIQSAELNGSEYNHNWLRYSDIMEGGVLHLKMGAEPNRQRGTNIEDRPFSLSDYQ